MTNLFIKQCKDIKKITIGRFNMCGGEFDVMYIPEKIPFWKYWIEKKYIKRIEKMYFGEAVYICGECDFLERTQAFLDKDRYIYPSGCIAINENIEALCRKICKNNMIDYPTVIAIYDRIFSEMCVDILNRLCRYISEVYIFTDNIVSQSYADRMIDEYGTTICIKRYDDILPQNTKIVIALDKTEKCTSEIYLIDLFGENEHTDKVISRLSFKFKDKYKAYECFFGEKINASLYDFLKLSDIKAEQIVNFLGYN